MSLIGMDNIWTNWFKGVKPKLQINIGKPFLPISLPKERTERNEIVKTTGEEIMCRIAALIPDEYHGVYADLPERVIMPHRRLLTEEHALAVPEGAVHRHPARYARPGVPERDRGMDIVVQRAGDQRHTAANIEKATRLLGYRPATTVAHGLRAQVEWQKQVAAT